MPPGDAQVPVAAPRGAALVERATPPQYTCPALGRALLGRCTDRLVHNVLVSVPASRGATLVERATPPQYTCPACGKGSPDCRVARSLGDAQAPDSVGYAK